MGQLLRLTDNYVSTIRTLGAVGGAGFPRGLREAPRFYLRRPLPAARASHPCCRPTTTSRCPFQWTRFQDQSPSNPRFSLFRYPLCGFKSTHAVGNWGFLLYSNPLKEHPNILSPESLAKCSSHWHLIELWRNFRSRSLKISVKIDFIPREQCDRGMKLLLIPIFQIYQKHSNGHAEIIALSMDTIDSFWRFKIFKNYNVFRIWLLAFYLLA